MNKRIGYAPKPSVNPGAFEFHMKLNLIIRPAALWIMVLLALVTVTLAPTANAGTTNSTSLAAQKERQLIALLNSNAPPSEKALACKQLTIYGTEAAVPALARLLSDEQLASWARIPLEAIPGSAPDAALRKAMGHLQGKLLVGVINSIGFRRDPKSIKGLGKHLNGKDSEAACAAAAALGRIGGDTAAKTLQTALTRAPAEVRPEVARACVVCAEGLVGQGKNAPAMKLYAAVRAAQVPKQIVMEATRGTILSQNAYGLPLLLEQLRSPDPAFFSLGLHTARELPGSDVTRALVTEMSRANPDRQSLLLLAVADRKDSDARAAVTEVVRRGTPKTRIVAIGALEHLGTISSLPVLLEAATSEDKEVSTAAFASLTRFPGNDVNSELLARLPQASGKTRQVLIKLAAKRRIDIALPVIAAAVDDPDPAARAAAIQSIGVLGDEHQIAALVRLLQRTQSSTERTDIETALTDISTRKGARCVPDLLPLAQDQASAVRLIALPVLASAGGSDALNAVKAAVQDSDEMVRDEAVRTLSTWPNNWPEDSAVLEPLRALAGDSQKPSYQVLALRGYLHFLDGDKQLKDSDKARKIKEVVPFIQRPEEQQLVVALAGDLHGAEAVDLLCAFAEQPALANDACTAILKLASEKKSGLSTEQRRQALKTVLEKAQNDTTRSKAEELLKEQQASIQ